MILLNGWTFPVGQSGEASRWRVCYQQGVPRLVSPYLLFDLNQIYTNLYEARNRLQIRDFYCFIVINMFRIKVY